MSNAPQEAPRESYALPPRDMTGVLFGLSLPQVIIAGGGVIMGIILMITVGFLVGFLVASVAAAGALIRVDGKPLLLALPLLMRRVVGGGFGGWDKPLPLVSRGGQKLPGPLAAQRMMAVPLEAVGYPGARPGATAAIVLDKRGLMTASIRAEAPQFALADAGEKDRRLASWAQYLGSLVTEQGLWAGLRWVEFASPVGVEEHVAWVNENLSSDPVPRVVEAYQSLLQEGASRALAHEVVLSLTLRVGRVRHRGPRGRNRTAARLLLAEMQRLRLWCSSEGMSVSDPLTPQETLRTVMARLNPLQVADTRVLEKRDASAAPTEPASARNLWQAWQVDATWHRALLVREWPRRAVHADWMGSLLSGPADVRAVAMFAEPVPISRSYRDVNRRAVKVSAEMESRDRAGRRVGSRHHRALEDHEQLEEELVAGFPEYQYCGLVIVAGEGLDALDVITEEVIASAAAAGIALSPLNGRHAAAVAATLPTSGGITSTMR